MADYTTVAMGVRSLVDDILRTDVPPPGTKSWAIPDGQGGFIEIPLADLAGDTPTPPTSTPRDPFAAGDVKAITDAVTAATNTWADGDLTAYGSPALQDAGAPPAVAGQNGSILVGSADVATMDEFDMTDGTGSAWRYRYSRRNDGTSGWTRIPKG